MMETEKREIKISKIIENFPKEFKNLIFIKNIRDSMEKYIYLNEFVIFFTIDHIGKKYNNKDGTINLMLKDEIHKRVLDWCKIYKFERRDSKTTIDNYSGLWIFKDSIALSYKYISSDKTMRKYISSDKIIRELKKQLKEERENHEKIIKSLGKKIKKEKEKFKEKIKNLEEQIAIEEFLEQRKRISVQSK